MATLTGQFISQSYGGIIQLSTNTGIITGSSTQLQDGLGTNLGIFLNGTGSLTSSADSLFNDVTVGKGGNGVTTNTAVGERALSNNTSAGASNTAIGYFALVSSSHGDNNVAVGRGASQNNTSGSNNVAIGLQAQSFSTTAGNNVSLGTNSLFTNVTGNYNIAIGSSALFTNKSNFNVAVGPQSLYTNSTGVNNVAVGFNTLYTNTSGQYNTAIGDNTGDGITTGNYNTILGASVTGLSSSLSNNIILADGAGNIRLRYSGSWTYSGSIAGEVRALTITSQTASIDLSTANLFTLTLVSGSNTHINPTNLQRGQTSMLQITQPATGSGTVTFNSIVKFPSGTPYTPTNTTGSIDNLSFVSYNGTTLNAVASYNFL
jgi:hypothetical protein